MQDFFFSLPSTSRFLGWDYGDAADSAGTAIMGQIVILLINKNDPPKPRSVEDAMIIGCPSHSLEKNMFIHMQHASLPVSVWSRLPKLPGWVITLRSRSDHDMSTLRPKK